MDMAVVDETFADVSTWWRWLAPTTRGVRLLTGNPRIGEHFEWLAAALDEIDRKRDIPVPDVARLLPHTLRRTWRQSVPLKSFARSPSGRRIH
jgi:hypothetical protein